MIIELIVGLFFALFGLNCAYFVAWQNLVTLFAYKLRAIASAQIGEKIYLVGKLTGEPKEQALFTQTPCIYWRCKVTETKGGGKHKSTITLLERRSQNSFLLADKSGLIEVLPLNYKAPLLRIGNDRFSLSSTNFTVHDFVNISRSQNRFHQNIFQEFSDPRAIAFLNEYGIQPKGMLGQRKSISILEYLGQPGDKIYVCGEIMRGDRHTKYLRIQPWLISTYPIYKLALFLMGFGLFGLLLFLIGLKILLEILRYH